MLGMFGRLENPGSGNFFDEIRSLPQQALGVVSNNLAYNAGLFGTDCLVGKASVGRFWRS